MNFNLHVLALRPRPRTVWGTRERKGVVPVQTFFLRTLLGAVVLFMAALLPASGVSFWGSEASWTDPQSPALHDVGPVSAAEANRSYDCSPLTYRQRYDRRKIMQTGCFIPTAFGLVDPAKSAVIFNGSDEADEIRYGGQQVGFSVIPFSGSIARFGGFPGLGSYLYLYGTLPNNLEDGGDMFGPAYKDASPVPSRVIEDGHGQPMAVNPGAFAYSARGQWLITESPAHALVRINLATMSVLPFAASFFSQNNPAASHGASMAITEDGRYAAIASKEYSTFKVYDLTTCKAASDGLEPQQCEWHDYWPYLKNQITGNLDRISRVQYLRNNVLSLNVTSGTATESYLLSPSGPITSLIPYLGVGDSYASGQGAWNYLAGTDTAVNHCHLSIYSYPQRLSGDLFANSGHSVACSGARMQDVVNGSLKYTGQSEDQRSTAERQADGSDTQILHDFTPGYLAQGDFVTAYQPGVITVQIGGNDVGFKDMILRCIGPGNCYSTYEDRVEVEQTVNRQYQRWVSLYEQLQHSSPTSKIFAIGYPQIVAASGSCGLNTPLSAGDIDFARTITVYINSVIQRVAHAAGVFYADITDSLAGFELCRDGRGPAAMNGTTAGNDALGILGQESFHPTAFGHDLIEQSILRQTHNFAAARPAANPEEPAPATDTRNPFLQTAPKSGRAIRTVIPATGFAISGNNVRIVLDGVETGLQPHARYTVKVDGTVIGSVTSDDRSNLSGSLAIPAGVTGSLHTIEAAGSGPNGTPITATQTLPAERPTPTVTLHFGLMARAYLGHTPGPN